MTTPSVGVLVPTLNAERELERCLIPILRSPIVTRCLVIDSASTDKTVAVAMRLGVEVHSISRHEFNHGATREKGRRILGTDIVVMVTQDIEMRDSGALETLVRPICEMKADVAYGRQLPRRGADILESFPRQFNYPENSHIRTLADVQRLGVYTFFCSDSFAAYRQSSLDRVGGFAPVLTNEDYFAVMNILTAGGSIAYVADAAVYHSHRYSLWAEFTRNFDTGYVRGERPETQQIAGNAEVRGLQMVRSLLAYILKKRPLLLPYATAHCCAKWLGYRVGYYSVRSPVWWKRLLSGQKYFWNSQFARTPLAIGGDGR